MEKQKVIFKALIQMLFICLLNLSVSNAKTANITTELFTKMLKKGMPTHPKRGLIYTFVDESAATGKVTKKSRLSCRTGALYDAKEIVKVINRELELENFVTCQGSTCSFTPVSCHDSKKTFNFEYIDGKLYLVAAQIGVDLNPQWSQLQFDQLNRVHCSSNHNSINRGLLKVCNTSQDKVPGLPLKSLPSWGKRSRSILSGAQMTDGTIVEDLNKNTKGWKKVSAYGKVGWVITKNTDLNGITVLCKP